MTDAFQERGCPTAFLIGLSIRSDINAFAFPLSALPEQILGLWHWVDNTLYCFQFECYLLLKSINVTYEVIVFSVPTFVSGT